MMQQSRTQGNSSRGQEEMWGLNTQGGVGNWTQVWCIKKGGER